MFNLQEGDKMQHLTLRDKVLQLLYFLKLMNTVILLFLVLFVITVFNCEY